MALPKQIRDQIKNNEDIEKALREETADVRKQEEDSAQAEIDALLNEVAAPDNEQAEEKPEEKPKAEVRELHPNQEEKPEEPKAERTDWKVKYSTLKGKYDAEVPRLTQNLREANDRIQSLEDKLANIAAPQEDEQQNQKARTDFTEEEIADYGEDLLDVIGRKARSIVENEYRPTINKLEQQVTSLKNQLGETGERVGKFEQNEVFAVLDREVKDWRKTNVDPEFHEWLDQTDPFSGETRKALLLKAFDRKNAHQVKAFFNSYAQEHAAVSPDLADSAPSGQGGKEPESRLNLEDYVAPGAPKGGQGSAGAPKDKRIWTSTEIGKFYSDVQKGRYKNRPEDKARIEADIVHATTEGRIQS